MILAHCCFPPKSVININNQLQYKLNWSGRLQIGLTLTFYDSLSFSCAMNFIDDNSYHFQFNVYIKNKQLIIPPIFNFDTNGVRFHNLIPASSARICLTLFIKVPIRYQVGHLFHSSQLCTQTMLSILVKWHNYFFVTFPTPD